MAKDIPIIILPSKSGVSKNPVLYSNGNILEETQRLIEEAELKLRSMEAGINLDANFTRPNGFSFQDEQHFSSNDLKTHRLKQALDSKMKKLEGELEMQWKKQATASDSADVPGEHSGTVSTVDIHGNKHAQRSRVRRPCKKSLNRGSQDVVEVVRTARDSVHGALVAARKLSATLEQSARIPSVPAPSENQPTGSESGRFCIEHGTKWKVCTCLRPEYEGLNHEAAPSVGANLISTRSNVAVFQAKSAIRGNIQQPQKRLQLSVMPSVSIKRSLRKQVMPVIEVPFPGSNPDTAKRENTGVRNFKHADPQDQKDDSIYVLRDGCEVLPKGSDKKLSSVGTNAESNSADVRQVCSVRELEHSQLKQILGILLEKVTSPETESLSIVSRRPPSGRRSCDEVQSDKSSVSSRNALREDSGGIAYNSLSRFLETYSKAAVDSKRAKRKAVERRKEEKRSMKAQEQRFKKNSAAQNQYNELNHVLIGPFRRAISNKSLAVASTSKQTGKDVDVAVVPEDNTADKIDLKLDLESGERKELYETRSRESKTTLEDLPSSKSSELLDDKSLEAESEAVSESLAHSRSDAEALTPPNVVAVESSRKTEGSSNDEYEDDWEEENDGDKNVEESVETRDVGDGSERDGRDDGLAHSLRTIMEVEENSSLSVSLVHHEPMSQPSQSGANKSGSQPTSTGADDTKMLPPSQPEKPKTAAEIPLQAVDEKSRVLIPKSTEIEAVSPADEPQTEKKFEEFSSNRAFLEMTEALKKMLETVVSNLVEVKPSERCVTDENARPKRLGVPFEGAVTRRGVRRYDPTSSGSANDDRVSSGSEASYSRNFSRSRVSRVRFKSGSKRCSATQTVEDAKRDAETQVTPDKRNNERERQLPDDLFLRPSKLSLSRSPLRFSKPISLSFDLDPTARLLAFGRNPYQIQGLTAGARVSPLPEPQNRESASQCDSFTSSCSSVLPTDEWEYPANNTLMSLSEGEVLAYHSCSCSEGEICLCAGKFRKGRNYGGKPSDQSPAEPVLAGSAPFTPNPWSTLDSDNLIDLSDHFSEGEVIEKLIGISHLLNDKARKETI